MCTVGWGLLNEPPLLPSCCEAAEPLPLAPRHWRFANMPHFEAGVSCTSAPYLHSKVTGRCKTTFSNGRTLVQSATVNNDIERMQNPALLKCSGVQRFKSWA